MTDLRAAVRRVGTSTTGTALAIRVVAVGLGFVQSVVIARLGGADVRGVTAVYISACMLIYLVASFDLAQQAVSVLRARGDFGPLPSLLRSAWLVYGGIALVVAAACWPVNSDISWLAVGGAAYLIGSQSGTVIGAIRGPVANAVALALQQTVLLLAVLAFAAVGRLDVTTIKVALIVSFLTPTAVYLLRSDRGPTMSAGALWSDLQLTIRQGVPWQLARVLQGSLLLIDTILVAKYLGDAAAGVYAVGFSLAVLPRLVGTQVAMGTYHRANVQDAHALGSDLRKSAGGTLVAYLGVLVVAPWIINVLYGPEFAGALAVYVLLMIGVMAMSVVQVCYFFTRVYGGPWRTVAYSAVGPVVLVALADPASQTFGVNGMAGLVSLASVLMVAPAVWIARRDRRAITGAVPAEPTER